MMDTKGLEAACRNIVVAATRQESDEAGSDGDWGAAQVLAHLIAANRSATELVAVVMAGAESAPFTNRGALCSPYLDAIVDAAGGFTGIVAEFERGSRELSATAAALAVGALETPIDTVLWEGGAVVFEERIPLAQLFTVIHAHLEGHLQQLSA